MATVELTTPQAQATGSRSSLYRALARSFRFPSQELHQDLKTGVLSQQMQTAIAGLPYQLAVSAPAPADISFEAMENAYLALFEVGGEYGAPCFLYEGEHGGGRNKVLEEVLRFYHYFGLRLSQEKRDRPDHLATELEFMHALTFKEAAALAAGVDPTPLRKAQRDFLRLHLEEFASTVASSTQDRPAPFYPHLARCTSSFCQSDLAFLEKAS